MNGLSYLRRGLSIAGLGLGHLARLRRGRGRVLDHLQAPERHPVPMPSFVQFRITNLCNLRCKMCGQWGDTGIYRADQTDPAGDGQAERARIRELIGLKRQLGLSDYERLLDELAPHRPVIGLFGGEPFLYPEIVDLIEAIKRRGLTLTIVTNGVYLEAHAEAIVRLGVDSLLISIDGTPEVHDGIRGRKGTFDALARGIHAIVTEQRRQKKVAPLQFAMLPITEYNADSIEEAIATLRDLPLDAVNLGLRWYIPENVGAEYEAVMRTAFGASAESWKGFHFDPTRDPVLGDEARLSQVVAALQRLKGRRVRDAMAGKPWLSFVPEIEPEHIPAYFGDYGETFGHNLCPAPWYFGQVEPDGDVTFCGDFPDYIIGNVARAPFRDVWQGERARRFREHLAREALPVCARCCGNYVFGRWPATGSPGLRLAPAGTPEPAPTAARRPA